jgi:imidazolonepropionase
MGKTGAEAASNDHWTLIRGARQLLTLRGASGPRRGSAMNDLNVIPDGAVLIRNGIIEDVGTTRRVENLEPARKAREIDAAGKVVMPAFADPDVALAAPSLTGRGKGVDDENDIRRMSRRRLDAHASSVAIDLARYGVLTVGAHTLFAPDLQNTLKSLRSHKALQSKPLRIRSVFSPPYEDGDENAIQRNRVSQSWMPSISQKKLAALMEIPANGGDIENSHALATAAAATGYNIRFRASGHTTEAALGLAYSAGAIAFLGGVPESSEVSRALSDVGCVHVALAAQILAGEYRPLRNLVDDGVPLALASGYLNGGTTSLNPQFMIYTACQSLGLTAEEAIVATTYNGVCSLRFSHVTGSLEPGKSADICMMDVGDYRELTRRAGHHDAFLVMRAGQIVYRRPSLTMD